MYAPITAQFRTLLHPAFFDVGAGLYAGLYKEDIPMKYDRLALASLVTAARRGEIDRSAFLQRAALLGGAAAFSGGLWSALQGFSPTIGEAASAYPISNMTATQLAALYKSLPFTKALPLPEGPIAVKGKVKQITLGFSQTGFNHPWRIAMIAAAQAEVARHPNVHLVITDGQVNIEKQSHDVQDLLAQNVDAVVMSPVEAAGLTPTAHRVMAANAPLIVLDRDMPTAKTLFIGQSNVTMGRNVARKMIQDLRGRGHLLEITGLIGSSPAIDRQRGMRDALKEAPGIKILATGDGQWIRDPAEKLMQDWLVEFKAKSIDAVFSHAEESSWGAELAIVRASRCGDRIHHYTHDGSNAGFMSVKRGTFRADGNYSPYIGDIGVRAALYALMGKTLIGKQRYSEPGWLYRLPDSPVVMAENATTWIGHGWGTFAPPPDKCISA